MAERILSRRTPILLCSASLCRIRLAIGLDSSSTTASPRLRQSPQAVLEHLEECREVSGTIQSRERIRLRTNKTSTSYRHLSLWPRMLLQALYLDRSVTALRCPLAEYGLASGLQEHQ